MIACTTSFLYIAQNKFIKMDTLCNKEILGNNRYMQMTLKVCNSPLFSVRGPRCEIRVTRHPIFSECVMRRFFCVTRYSYAMMNIKQLTKVFYNFGVQKEKINKYFKKWQFKFSFFFSLIFDECSIYPLGQRLLNYRSQIDGRSPNYRLEFSKMHYYSNVLWKYNKHNICYNFLKNTEKSPKL